MSGYVVDYDVHSILESLLKKILVDKPSDPVQFLIDELEKNPIVVEEKKAAEPVVEEA